MAKAKLAESVLAELKAISPKRKNWFDKLSPDARDKILEVRRLRQAGETDASVRTVAAYVKQLGGKVCTQTLMAWLDEKND